MTSDVPTCAIIYAVDLLSKTEILHREKFMEAERAYSLVRFNPYSVIYNIEYS